jgi:hypothetical protein
MVTHHIFDLPCPPDVYDSILTICGGAIPSDRVSLLDVVESVSVDFLFQKCLSPVGCRLAVFIVTTL